MSAIYRPKSIRKGLAESARTLRTCSDLHPNISDNFHFWVLEHIFDDFGISDASRDLTQNGSMSLFLTNFYINLHEKNIMIVKNVVVELNLNFSSF